MDGKRQLIRKAILELQIVDSKDIVKVAGLVSRIQNWFKALNNPEYKAQVDTLKDQSERVDYLSEELQNELRSLKSSLENTDVDQYNASIERVKELALQISPELMDLGQKAQQADLPKDVKKEYEGPQEYIEEADRLNPKTQEKVRKYFPPDYDVDIGWRVNKSMQDYNWFKKFTANNIGISAAPAENLLKSFIPSIAKNYNKTEDEIYRVIDNNRAEFWANVKNGILNGRLNYNFWAKHKERRPTNQMQISVTTPVIEIPELGFSFYATVLLIDLAASLVSNDILSVRSFQNVRLAPGTPASIKSPTPMPLPDEGKVESEEVTPEDKPSDEEENVGDVYDDGRFDYTDVRDRTALRISELKKFAAGQEHPRRSTILGRQQIADALKDAYRKLFGKDPTLEVLGTGWSQVALETGGGSRMNNYNFGNITTTGEESNYWVFKQEAGMQEFDPSGKDIKLIELRFKSYNSPEEGATDYWRLLARKYPKALEWFGTGNVLNSALELGDSGYYTASKIRYSDSMVGVFDKFMKTMGPSQGLDSAPTASPVGPKPEYAKFREGSPEQDIPEEIASVVSQYTIKQAPAIYDDLMRSLLAKGPVESLIRKIAERELLPTTSTLLVLSSEPSYPVRIRYARILCSALREELGADTAIYHDGKHIEIECDVVGSKKVVVQAVRAVSGGVSDAFQLSSNRKVSAGVFNNIKSSYKLLDSKTSEDQFRKFAFEMMGKK